MKVAVVICALICSVVSEAPYPPSGWKPSGALLVLPSPSGQNSFGLQPQQSRQQQLPTSYGPPTTPSNTNQAEASDNGSNSVSTSEQQPQNGQAGDYYVLLPNGKLQRIRYTGSFESSLKNNAGETQTQTQSQSSFGQLQFQSNNFDQKPIPSGQNSFGQFQFQANSQNQKQFQSNGQYNFDNRNSQNRQTVENNRFPQFQEASGSGQASNNVDSFQKFNGQQTRQQNAFQHNELASESSQSGAALTSKTDSSVQDDQANRDKAALPKLVAQFSEAQLKANGPFPDGYVASVQFSEVPPITAPVYVFNPAPLVRVLRMTP